MKKYMKTGKRNMVLRESPTRISTKQPKVSKTRRLSEKEVSERFIKVYFLLLIFKLQSRESLMIQSKG